MLRRTAEQETQNAGIQTQRDREGSTLKFKSTRISPSRNKSCHVSCSNVEGNRKIFVDLRLQLRLYRPICCLEVFALLLCFARDCWRLFSPPVQKGSRELWGLSHWCSRAGKRAESCAQKITLRCASRACIALGPSTLSAKLEAQRLLSHSLSWSVSTTQKSC